MQAAAIDSGAIEGLYPPDRGFTLTVLAEAAAWEAQLGTRSTEQRQLIEAQFAGYQLALDAATSATPISEAWIRRIHEVVCAPQKTIRVLTPQGFEEQDFTAQGIYKVRPNHVRSADGRLHSYAPVSAVPDEMRRFVEQMRSDEFQAAHPALQAAYAHFCLTSIHPFQDGNGRVARVLASVFLCRAASVPLVIFEEEKAEYFQALAAADAAKVQPFANFIFGSAVRSIDLVSDQLRPAPAPLLPVLRDLLTGHGGLAYRELDQIGVTLLNEAIGAFHAEVEAPTFPPGITAHKGTGSKSSLERVGGYRTLVGGSIPYHELVLTSDAPASGATRVTVDTLVSRDKDNLFVFAVRIQAPWGTETLPVRLSEAYPLMTESLRLRLRTRARGVLAETLAQLATQAQSSLRGAGYE